MPHVGDYILPGPNPHANYNRPPEFNTIAEVEYAYIILWLD